MPKVRGLFGNRPVYVRLNPKDEMEFYALAEKEERTASSLGRLLIKEGMHSRIAKKQRQ